MNKNPLKKIFKLTPKHMLKTKKLVKHTALDEFAIAVKKQFDRVGEQFGKVYERLDVLENKMDQGFGEMNQRLNKMAQRFNEIDKKLDILVSKE